MGLYLLDEGEGRLEKADALGKLAVPGLFLTGGTGGPREYRQACSDIRQHCAELSREGLERFSVFGLEPGEAFLRRFQRICEGAARAAIRIFLLVPENAQEEVKPADPIKKFHIQILRERR